jgi:hypothetical protein
MTVYTIGPTILTSAMAVTTDVESVPGQAYTPGAPMPDPFESYASFPALAKTSGGKAFYSRNDIDREIDESVCDGVNYYTISYLSTHQSDEAKSYRKIHIGFTVPAFMPPIESVTSAGSQPCPHVPGLAFLTIWMQRWKIPWFTPA